MGLCKPITLHVKCYVYGLARLKAKTKQKV
jgi:hypothetical protein